MQDLAEILGEEYIQSLEPGLRGISEENYSFFKELFRRNQRLISKHMGGEPENGREVLLDVISKTQKLYDAMQELIGEDEAKERYLERNLDYVIALDEIREYLQGT